MMTVQAIGGSELLPDLAHGQYATVPSQLAAVEACIKG
jgi:hypothetical protein